MNDIELQTLNGITVGDAVRLPSIKCTFEVVAVPDESTLLLRSPSGREARAGWRAVTRVKTNGAKPDER